MKKSRNSITITLVTVLLISALSPLLIQPTQAQPTPDPFTDLKGWKKFETDIITIMFPADGQHPMFLWWYTPQNDTVYNVHYKGLIEYYLPPKATHFTRRNTTDIDTLARTFLAEQNALQRRFRNLHQMRTRGLGMNGTFPRLGRLVGRLARGDIEEAIEIIEDLQEQADEIAREAEAAGEEDLHNQAQHVLNNLTMLEEKLEDLEENHGPPPIIHDILQSLRDLIRIQMQTIRTQIRENIQRRSLIVEALKQLRGRLHPPFFPFFNGRWELIPPEEFNASDGTPLGVAFAFNLTRVRNPQWKFAEGNVLIKCRFYYTPVTEVIEDVSYTVQRAEMKMDFVITEWKWNIDVLIQVIEELNEEYGMDLPLPNVERAGLALWLDLTSFNATGTEGILEIGEGAESVDEATSLKESITEMIEASQHLIETMEEGYEELEEGREEIQEELAAGNPDWVDIQEQILEMIDDSIEDVIEELKEDQMTINETLSTIQEIVEPETYEQIEANISGILASVDSVVGRLEALNGTLNDLLEVEEVATFNYNLSSLAVDYQQALVDLRTAVTTGLQDLYQRLMDMGEKIAQKAKASRMKIRDRLVDIKEDLALGQERPLDVSVRLGRLLKIGFATENTTLAGWFQFVNFTRLTYPDGENTTAPVKAAYLQAGAHLRLYLLYRYFDNATLIHDPSIGLTVPETSTPEATTPQYEVKVPSGTQLSPQESLRIIPPLVTTELLLLLLGVASIMAIAVGIAKWRKKVINFVGGS